MKPLPFVNTPLLSLAIIPALLAAIGTPRTEAQVFVQGNSLSDRYFCTDNDPTNAQVVLDFPIVSPGLLLNILTWGQSVGIGISGIGESFDAYVFRPVGPSSFMVMTNTGYLTVASAGLNTFDAPPFELQPGDFIAHYGRGIPLATGTGGPSSVYDDGAKPLPKPVPGQIITLPSPTYPLYNDGGRDYAIAVATRGVPNLNIALSGDTVILSWPAAGANTLLESADPIGGLWTTNATITSTAGINYVTNTAATGTRFFRLRTP